MAELGLVVVGLPPVSWAGFVAVLGLVSAEGGVLEEAVCTRARVVATGDGAGLKPAAAAVVWAWVLLEVAVLEP